MPRRKIIIDTDPGCDDVLAMLLALSASPDELEVLLISVTYGNIDVQNCLRNTVSLFHHIEREITWRKQNGRPAGFETLQRSRPLVAVGPDQPLADQKLMADYFHGTDGLGGVHDSHPHLSPADTWQEMFNAAEHSRKPEDEMIAEERNREDALFVASRQPAHEEILRLLRENEPDTVSIVAIGPLTNLAIAAATDPETFLRVKEVIVMGGVVNEPGNVNSPPVSATTQKIPEPPFRLIKAPPGPIRDKLTSRNQMTPCAEFNTFADPIAAARVYALTSPNPRTTMPPTPPAPPGQQVDAPPPPYLGPYPKSLSRKLRVVLFPLDITEQHLLTRGEFRRTLEPLIRGGSPLAEWVNVWLNSTFAKVESLQTARTGDAVGLQLHDPLCIWYCLDPPSDVKSGEWQLAEDEDIRVETSGQWTRGMCVIDRRSRYEINDANDVEDGVTEVAGDHGNWLSKRAGNRLARCIGSPGVDLFGIVLLQRIFAL